MHTWYDYRSVWSAHPWVILIGILGLALIVASVVGTVLGNPLVVAFIPGLAALYVHHLVAMRKLD